MDFKLRFTSIVKSLRPVVLELASFPPSAPLFELILTLAIWAEKCSTLALDNFIVNRDD